MRVSSSLKNTLPVLFGISLFCGTVQDGLANEPGSVDWILPPIKHTTGKF